LECHPRYRHLRISPLEALNADPANVSGDIYFDDQVRVLDWPVDFVLKVRSAFRDVEGLVCLAVECDGHDFHERTKEQAARDRSRDRALQAAGYTVMRFTGSELYRDPMRCVREVLEWAHRGHERF
jgi:very-short-patch-repair endonuclease